MQRDVSDLRQEINRLDAQLVELLNIRAQLAEEIGNLKREEGKDVYDAGRERVVLEKIEALNDGPLSKGALEEIFSSIMTACRELQLK